MIDTIDQVKEIIQHWEDGIITRAEFDHRLLNIYLKPMFKALIAGEQLMAFGSCCCSSHPPDITVKTEIVIKPRGYTITPIE